MSNTRWDYIVYPSELPTGGWALGERDATTVIGSFCPEQMDQYVGATVIEYEADRLPDLRAAHEKAESLGRDLTKDEMAAMEINFLAKAGSRIGTVSPEGEIVWET